MEEEMNKMMTDEVLRNEKENYDANEIIKLRGHHLICTSLFVGEGYSDGFAANLEQLIVAMKKPDAVVELVASQDYVCSACPKLGKVGKTQEQQMLNDDEKNTVPCRLDEVAKTDRMLLDRLLFKPGYQDTYANIRKQFCKQMTEEIFVECCGQCSWMEAGLCSYEKLKNSMEIEPQ